MTSPRFVLQYISILVLCSVVDWALTVDAISMGVAEEANPIIGAALEKGIAFTLIYKLAWVVVGVILLQLLGRGSKLSVWGMRLLVGVYIAVVMYQCFARLFVL